MPRGKLRLALIFVIVWFTVFCLLVFFTGKPQYSPLSVVRVIGPLSTDSQYQQRVIQFERDLQLNEYLNNLSELQLFEKLSELYEKEYLIPPPTHFDRWVKFAKKNQCFLALSYYKRLHDDLKPFRDPLNPKNRTINLDKLNDFARQRFRLTAAVNITEGFAKVYYNATNATEPGVLSGGEELFDKNDKVFILINENDEPLILPADENPDTRYKDASDSVRRNHCLRANASLDNEVFFVEPASFVAIGNVGLLPIMSPCKPKCYSDILIPSKYDRVATALNDTIPWEQKENKLMWRGTTTGSRIYLDNKNWERGIRPRLVKLATSKQSVSEEIGIEFDVAFSGVVQCYQRCSAPKVNRKYRFGKYISMDDQLKAKYQIVVDGNTYANRLFPLMQTKTVIFLSTMFDQWFSHLLIPFYHYIPVAYDLSDLIDNMHYAANHDDEMRQVGENMNWFATRHLRKLDEECYTGLLLLEYADLLNNTTTK